MAGLKQRTMMIYVYLRVFLIPIAVLGYVLFAILFREKSWKQVTPDLQVAIFVCNCV